MNTLDLSAELSKHYYGKYLPQSETSDDFNLLKAQRSWNGYCKMANKHENILISNNVKMFFSS